MSYIFCALLTNLRKAQDIVPQKFHNQEIPLCGINPTCLVDNCIAHYIYEHSAGKSWGEILFKLICTSSGQIVGKSSSKLSNYGSHFYVENLSRELERIDKLPTAGFRQLSERKRMGGRTSDQALTFL